MKIIEKDELRALKKHSVARLQATKVDTALFNAVDTRLTDYLLEVIHNPDRHNLYELLSVERFFYMVDKYELRKKAVRRFIAVYEFLEYPGATGPSRYKLTPVQTFQFTNIFGFYYHGTERRVITEFLLFVPRKFSKTTSVASIMVDDLLHGDNNAQGYAAANSYDQAHICFDVIQYILRRLDTKMRRFKVNREQVYNLMPGKTSFVRCLATSPDKLDGLNASTVVIDEYAQADSAALKNVLTSSMGVRLNPLTGVITTASDKTDTPFMEMLEGCKAILRGELENDSIFAHIFEPDVDDEEGDPATWRKVQPHIGVTVREEFYQDQWAKAQMSSESMKEFRNKLLNIFAKDSEQEWITEDMIKSRYSDVPRESLRGCRCVCTIDLSVSDDLSAVTFIFFLPGRSINGLTECPFHSLTWYYIPSGVLEKHINRELYQRWVDKGYMRVIDGPVIDTNVIANDILSTDFNVLGIGYDPYKSLEMVRTLEFSVGTEFLYPISQTYGNFTSPVECTEMAIHQNKITFDPNPITAWCFGNAVIDEDRMENRKPIKHDMTMKIDGAITNVMGFWMLNNIKTMI